MNDKTTLLESQPVAVAGGAVSVVALIMALLLMLNSLGVLSLTEAQLDAIKTFLIPAVAIVGPINASAWARAQVTPVAKLTAGATVETATGETGVIIPAAQAQMLGIEELRP